MTIYGMGDGVTHTYGENAELDAWVHGHFYLSITTSVPKQPVSSNLFQVEK